MFSKNNNNKANKTVELNNNNKNKSRKGGQSFRFEQLEREIPKTAEFIENGRIKVLRVYKNKKNPEGEDYYNKPSPLSEVKQHTGNFGVCVGFNHESGSSIAVIDIDGFKYKKMTENLKKMAPNDKIKHLDSLNDKELDELCQKSKDYLLKCLVDLFPSPMVSKSASGGYHIFIFNKTLQDEGLTDRDHYISKNLKFGSGCEIEELRGLHLMNSLEIFTNFKTKQVVLPSSFVNDKGIKGAYKRIDDPKFANSWDTIGTVDDLAKTVKDGLMEKGLKWEPIDEIPSEQPAKHQTNHNNSYNYNDNLNYDNSNLGDLDPLESKDISDLAKDVGKIIDLTKEMGNHHKIIISLSNGLKTKKIKGRDVYNIIKEALNEYHPEHSKEHLTQVDHDLKNSSKVKKTGFKSIIEEVKEAKPYIDNIGVKIKRIRKLQNIPNYENIRTKFYSNQPQEVRDRLHTSTTNYYEDIFKGGYYQEPGVIYKLDTDNNDEIIKKPFANFSIDNITRVRDSTKLETEPYFDLVFYNNYDKELQIIYNQTMPNIINELIKQNLFMSYKKEQVKLFFSNLLFYLNINDELQTEKRAFYDGFFLNKDTNKIIDNSNIKDLRYNENYNNNDIVQALEVLENIINFKQESRYNNAYVYKWSIGAPFHWILKELGTANNNIKMLVLYGEQNTGKSQILLFTLWLYGIDIGKYNNVVETLSSLTKEINKDTYPVFLDDAYELLINKGVKGTLKTSTYNIYSRSVTDLENRNNNKLYLALSTIAASYNENRTLEDGEQRRYFNINYTSDMRLNKEEIDKFNKQFKPTQNGSILECWKYLGAEFRDYLQKLILNNDDLLYNLEELTTQFFKDLYKKVDRIGYTPLITNIENNTDQFVNKALLIQNYFNIQIRKVLRPSNQGYTKGDIEKAVNTNMLNGFYKLPSNSKNEVCQNPDNYFICAKEFKTIIQTVTNNVMDIKAILSELELLNSDWFIKLNIDPKTNKLILDKQQYLAGDKNKRGFYINVNEIATHILNVQLINGDYPEEEWLKEASTEEDCLK